jgi:hypothetical protein
VGTETCLNVTYRELLIEGSKSCSGRGSSVAVYKDYISTTLLKHITHTIKDSGSDVSKILPLLHDIEVVIGLHFEDSEHLVEHLPVLTSDAYNGFKLVWTLLELLDQRAHLNGLWTSSED